MKHATRVCSGTSSVRAWPWLAIWLFALFATLPSAGAWARDLSLDAASTGAAPVPLAPYFSVLEDPDRKLTLADVQRPALQEKFASDNESERPLNYGFNQSAFWLRLALRNESNAPLERLISIDFLVLSHIDFHSPLATGGYRSAFTGVALPFSTRTYPSRLFVFPVALPANSSQTFYFRVQSDNGMLVPATLWEPSAFRAHERSGYITQSAYFGLAAALILYNLLLFFTLRDLVYLLYSVFAATMALAISAANGFGTEFLWPQASYWSNISINVLYSLAFAAQIMFIRHTLDLKTVVPRADALLKYLMGAMLIFPIGFFVSIETFAKPVSVVWASSGLAMLGVLLYCTYVKKQRLAPLVAIAFSMLLVGGLMVELKTLAWIPHTSFTQQGLQLGSALEMLLLAFTLAYRFNLIRRDATAVVEQSNVDLERHLQAKEAELTATHLKLRESEHLQTLSEERQRLMQDMHDGMGSSLTTALRVVERGHLDEAAVAQVLKSCIDDLKLAIDSMEPLDADLLLLLATLRFRLGPRLENSGIRLKWNVGPVAPLDWLEPKSALHILRILQEALANVIKHANATEIVVATKVEGDQVAISVCDNGAGFPLQQTAREFAGKGLANQQRRAHDMGASVGVVSSGAGTCLTLLLPIKRLPL